jgi:acetyl esterase
MAKAKARGIFGDSISLENHTDYYKTVSPVYLIPDTSERVLPPQLCIVGSKDYIVTPQAVMEHVSRLRKAGQSVEYWEYEGKPHAFLDTRPNQFLGTAFYKDAPPAIDRIVEFLDRVLQKN